MYKTVFKLTGLVIAAALGYLLFWPVPIDPVAWDAPQSAGYVGDFEPNDELKALKFLQIGGHSGPEEVAIGADGMIYAATHGGAILRIDPATKKVNEFANTGGRPLGIELGNPR